MKISIRKCSTEDLVTLREISIQTYEETFRAFNSPENMKAYLDSAFSHQKLRKELNTPGSEFYFLFVDQTIAAYLKVNETQAQTDIFDPAGLEVERIYVKKEFQGLGFGKQLLNLGIEKARQQNKRFVWLGVWEHNEKALAFYKRMGFKKFSSHDFIMGDDRQTDFLMKKELT